MGVKKIGDRVRIFVAIKQLRNKSVYNRKQLNMVSRHQKCIQLIDSSWHRASWRLSKLQRLHPRWILLAKQTVANED